jgi:hypothetical protein
MQAPEYKAGTWVYPSPTQIPETGMMYAGTKAAHPCPTSHNFEAFPLDIQLIDGKPYTARLANTTMGPAQCDDKSEWNYFLLSSCVSPCQVVNIWEYTVTVHKAFTD